ncbi:unnamed protein product, partial [Ceratitis capitata]
RHQQLLLFLLQSSKLLKRRAVGAVRAVTWQAKIKEKSNLKTEMRKKEVFHKKNHE